MSKGSKRRPCLVPREEFDRNWDDVFGSGSRIVETIRRDMPLGEFAAMMGVELEKDSVVPLHVGDTPVEKPKSGETKT